MTYVLIGLRRSGKCLPTLFACANVRFALQAILPLRRCPFYMSAFFGSHAPQVFPSSPSLPSAGWDGVGWSRDALVLLPEGFPLLPLDQSQAGGVEEPLVARSVHRSSLLSPRFIRGLGIQELLSGGELLLPVLSRLALPPHLCTLGEVLGRESSGAILCSRLPLPSHLCTLSKVVSRPSAAPVRVLPGLLILGLGSQEGV